MVKNRYKDVYIPQNWVPLLKQALNDPEIQRKLLLRNLPNTPQGVAKLVIQEFLEGKSARAKTEQESTAPQQEGNQKPPNP